MCFRLGAPLAPDVARRASRRAVLPQMAVEARLPLVAPAWMVAAMGTVAVAVGDAAVQAQASSFIILSPSSVLTSFAVRS